MQTNTEEKKIVKLYIQNGRTIASLVVKYRAFHAVSLLQQ